MDCPTAGIDAPACGGASEQPDAVPVATDITASMIFT
jgi:hypothetical protein